MKLILRKDIEADGTINYVVKCDDEVKACTSDYNKAKVTFDELKDRITRPSKEILEEVEI